MLITSNLNPPPWPFLKKKIGFKSYLWYICMLYVECRNAFTPNRNSRNKQTFNKKKENSHFFGFTMYNLLFL